MSDPSRWARAAVAHVDARATGDPLPRHLRITLNFHPDRGVGRSVVQSLARDGEYRSQFETGTSNGGLTAHAGGDRWRWENALFGGAYDDAPAAERPKYGALDHRRRPLGAAPRFGSAHLVLREAALDRATFCYPDSAFSPGHVATAHRFDLLPLVAADDAAVIAGASDVDPLDGYVEAQVHGRVLLDDVEELVLDPCYRGTRHEAEAVGLGVPVRWHEGRVITVDELRRHVDYRGPAAVAVGEQVAVDGLVDALVIGKAARSGRFDPQAVKQLWHLTAQWGWPRA